MSSICSDHIPESPHLPSIAISLEVVARNHVQDDGLVFRDVRWFAHNLFSLKLDALRFLHYRDDTTKSIPDVKFQSPMITIVFSGNAAWKYSGGLPWDC